RHGCKASCCQNPKRFLRCRSSWPAGLCCVPGNSPRSVKPNSRVYPSPREVGEKPQNQDNQQSDEYASDHGAGFAFCGGGPGGTYGCSPIPPMPTPPMLV